MTTRLFLRPLAVMVLLAYTKGYKKPTEILEYIRDRYGIDVSSGAFYPIFYSLQAKNYIKDGKVTKKGLEEIKKYYEIHKKMLDDIEKLGLS